MNSPRPIQRKRPGGSSRSTTPSARGRSAIDRLPAPELTARFRESLAQLWRTEDGKIGLAVSGGPDSLALLLLAQATCPDRIEAATVDHGLRSGSAEEAAMVAEVCAVLDVPHAVLSVHVHHGNLQAQAREARYSALAEWAAARGLGALATAHHADDQAETLLMRLNRGSSVAGLAGIRARGQVPATDLPLLRPLLDWRRSELADLVAAAGLTAAADPSNLDERFDRVKMRAALVGANWLDIPALAQSASHLADADAALDWAARREWAEQVEKGPMGLTYRPRAPKAVALRVLARIVAELGGEAPRGSAVARLFDHLVTRQPASIDNLVARPMPDGWSFTRAPQRRS